MSRAALLDGVEWNVRLSRVGTPALLEKFRATFDTYWNDPSFETYDPERDRDRLDDALAEASGRTTSDRVTLSLSGLEVHAFPYQQAMLDALDVERRVHDRHRNLIVAATGTGKTVVAALDYRAISEAAGKRPSLLFVAHRREILEQSQRSSIPWSGSPNQSWLQRRGLRRVMGNDPQRGDLRFGRRVLYRGGKPGRSVADASRWIRLTQRVFFFLIAAIRFGRPGRTAWSPGTCPKADPHRVSGVGDMEDARQLQRVAS